MSMPTNILIVDDDREIRVLLADFLASNGFQIFMAAQGNEMGADDYMSKPFKPRELLARIRNVLRRRTVQTGYEWNAQRVHFSNWTFDLVARHLFNPEGTAVILSAAEYRLLKIFLQHPNQILIRDQLCKKSDTPKNSAQRRLYFVIDYQ